MRRLIFLLLVGLTLISIACKHRRHAPVEADDGKLLSTVQASDPRGAVQLVSGFYNVEERSWRWTARRFTVTLRPPKGAAQNGARLVLKFAVPEPVLQKLQSLKLSANVNGLELPPEEYTKPGDVTYSRDVPASALKADAVNIDFTLDKALPPSPSDQRELGVIVNSVGLEAK